MKRQTILKSILCFLMALVCNVAWAQDAPVQAQMKLTGILSAGNSATYHEGTTTGNWYGKLVKSSSPNVTFEVEDQTKSTIGWTTKESIQRPLLQAGENYIVSLPEGYLITGYTLVTQSTTANNKDTFKYTTADGLVESEQQTTTNSTITVDGLSTNQIEIDLTEYSKSGTNGIMIWDITLNYTVAGMPYVSNAPSNGAWDENTVWYQIKNGNSKTLRADVLTNEGYLALTNTNATEGDAGLWCIVGDANNGYTFYNRAKGPAVALGMKGQENTAQAEFVSRNSGDYVTAFDFAASTFNGGNSHWCVKEHGTATNYWNERAPRLAYWNNSGATSNDMGSAYLFTQVDLSAITGLATEEEITAAQALIKVAPGYPKATTNQYRVLDVIANSPTKGAIKAELDAAVAAYKACTNILLPEDGKAYTFTLVHTDKAEYKISVDANKHLQATTDGTAATFYCHAFMVGNEQRYVFISEEGKILAYQTVTDTYTIIGNLTNDFTAGGMYSRSGDIITSTPDERFGLIYLTAKARAANNETAGSIIYKPTGATAFDNSADPYHNGTYTSAIKATEVPSYTINDVQTLALAKVKAKQQIAAMKLGSYVLTDKNGATYNSLTTADAVVEAATTTEEIDAFIASRSLNLPTPGTAYYLKDNHGTYLDLHHLGEDAHRYEHELATMSATKQLLYITGSEADGTWKIHTTVDGGNYLHQSSSKGWNSKVSSNGGDFKWEVEGVDVSGTPHYMLKNISGQHNGYLGADSHTAGNALYVDQSDQAKKLKMQLLPVKSITLSAVTTAEWLNEESVAVPSNKVPVAVDEKYKEKVVSSGEYFYISAGRLKGVFQHRSNSGNNRTDIVAVEVIDLEGNVVASDYHWGYTGNNSENNIYTMDILEDGLYYIRYYAEYVDNGGAHNSDVDITYINGPAEGYYYMSNRDVARHEHLYNNALHTGNATMRFTLQSDTRVETNNGIWHIIHNLDGTMSIKNGDGNHIVAGASYGGSILGTYEKLTINTYKDGYYYFTEALNCSNGSNFTVGGVPFLTTWAGHPDAADNQWRIDPVSVEGKTIYEVVVNGDANAYVAYNDGTTTQNAFNGGFFIADEPITEAQVKAGFAGNVVKSATITVEDNVITLADVVTFPTPVKQDLYNTSNGSLEVPPYRIPGITVDPETGRIITTAARLVCGTDPGYGQVDVVCRISDNHGDTWSEMKEVAVGTGITSPTENFFDTAFGDPAVVADRTSDEVLIIVVAGCTKYQTATRQIPNEIGTIHSLDNGNTWGEPVGVTEQIYSLFDAVNGGNPIESAFVGGGKIFQSRIVKVGKYYRLYAAMCARPNGNRVIYSDDFGRTWHALGGASALPAPGGDEPKCEEMPDGRVILSSRVGGGRIYNIYTYTNTATAEGSWEGAVTSTFEGSGKTHNGQSTNGEILIVPVVRNSDQKEMYLTLQSLPAGGGRSHVGIFYKELTDMTDINTVANFAIDWNGYFEVTDKTSAYSSMDLQNDGRIGFIYEENYTKHGEVSNPHSIDFPDANNLGTHNYDGYDNIYVAYPLEFITNNAYSIKGSVDRREFLRSYFTDLTADAVDEVKAAVATNLEGLSTEPAIGEVDNIYFILSKGSAVTAFDEHAGKAGFFTNEAVATYKTEVMAATRPEELAEAKAKLLASKLNIVSGKAYTFKNVQKDGTTVRWYKYDTAEGKIVLTADESEATPFVCRLLDDEKYVFVCNDGKYMTWRASVNGYTNGTGVQNAYHGEGSFLTDITIAKMTVGANITGDLSNTRYVSISANRPDKNPVEVGYVVVKKNGGSPTFDGAGAAYYNDNYSSAFIMEEAPYANTPVLNGVGEGELLSANLHNKYMGTFSAPFPTIVPEGVTAYYATECNGYVTLNAIARENAIAANTGVVLVGEAAGNAVMVPAAAETVASTDGNLLAHSAGADKDMTDVANAYQFVNGNQGTGFYKLSGGTLPMNEAYLQINDEKEAIGIRFVVKCKIDKYKIATFYANDAMNIPSKVKAYVATTAPVMDGENGIITMTEITDGIIPAKTGAVLRGEPGDYTFEPATKAGDTEVTGNLLHGYAGTAEYETVELPTDGSTNYVLTVKNEKVAFYRKEAGFKVYNNKAYLNVPESNGQARALYFNFDNDATGIVETENESEKTEIYDLAGRRVQKVQKGLYIVNGKKVLK